MKHIFIINPKSGKNDNTDFIRQQLEKTDFDWEIYNTAAPKDAIRFIREWCGKHDEEVRSRYDAHDDVHAHVHVHALQCFRFDGLSQGVTDRIRSAKSPQDREGGRRPPVFLSLKGARPHEDHSYLPGRDEP